MSRPGRRAAPVVLVLAGLVAGAALAPVVLPPVAGDDPTTPVATVGGRTVGKHELSDYLFRRYRNQYRRTLDELIDERIARAEAGRIGLRVPLKKIADAVAKEVEARAEVQRDVYGEGGSLEDWVQRGYGVDVTTWKRAILTPRFESLLLRQRVVRLHNRSDLRIHVRLIVTRSAEKARRVMRKLRAGADFSLIALKQSEDETARVGGSLPPIARGDLAGFPVVEQKLFATAPGALLGPLRVRVGGAPQWQIYKVVKRDEPWRMHGRALFEALEADIERSPVTRAEYEIWRARMRRERQVRYFAPDGSAWSPPR